jgi:TRAP-type C4-dicarboxylate transport system substrate-binding protein
MYPALLGPTVVSMFPERSETMSGMTTRSRRAALVLAAIAIAAAGCRGGAGEDKAGGSGEPVVLRLANTNGEIAFTPAVEYFVKRVDELSSGDLRVEVVNEWGAFASDREQQVVRAVSGGEVDLGWAGTRVFDTLGVESFEALTAPMLVDSYALENAVIESGISEEMMQGLDELGVVGLGVLPDGLRRPIAVSGPLRGLEDWRRIAFGTLRSNGHAEAIQALGATPFFGDREEALDNGSIEGFEASIWVHRRNPALAHLAPYVTANVILWPQMDVLLANQARLEALTEEQREWLDEAARDAATRSDALAEQDAQVIDDSCATGARFAEASAADLAALRAAFAPVYVSLRRNPETRTFIERIESLKESTAAERSVSIPSDCSGKAPEEVTGGTGPAPSYLNGTYRFVLTQEDADKVGDLDTGYPQVTTIKLTDGRLEGGCFGSEGGTYSVANDRITFHSVEYGADLTVTFSVDDDGSLRLTPVPPMDPGDAFTCFYKPWTKIAGTGPTKSAPANLNGTYRYVLTRADARKEVPQAGDIDSYPHLETWTLKDGWYSNPGGLAGSYSVDGNRITFDVPDFGYALTFTFSVDDAGNLHLTPVPPMDPGDRFVWSYKTWKKID